MRTMKIRSVLTMLFLTAVLVTASWPAGLTQRSLT